jgi:hypothetical protein
MLSLEGNPADELEGRQRINSKDTPEGSLRSLKAEARRLHSASENRCEKHHSIDNTHNTFEDNHTHHEDMISETLKIIHRL